MNSDRILIFAIPAGVAVVVHLVFLLLIEGRWSVSTPAVIASPKVIQASLVSMSAPTQKPKPKPKPEPKPKPKSKPKPAPLPVVTPEPSPAASEPEEEPPESPEITPEEALAELQKELLEGFDDLPNAEVAIPDSALEAVQQVAALMQARITQNWTRPPSARNGMEILLTISLIPTGEVVGISIVTGSGSNAFDRSAIAAVERSGRFSEVATLSISDFERYFRRFPLRFKPEDLRY